MVPYADWNLLKFPDKEQAMEKILDLTMLSDIFPTGYHGAVTAGVDARLDGLRRRRRPGRPRRRALGAAARRGRRHRRRPDPRAPGAGAQLRLRDRSTSPRATRKDQIEQILGVPEVDAAVDAVGFEARGHGAGRRPRGAGDRPELDHGRHPRRRAARHPRPLRHRRPRRRRRRRQGGLARRSASASAGPSRTASPPASARS